jgi:restriction system protein
MEQVVPQVAGLTEEQLAVEFPPGSRQSGSKVVNRLHWARSYLKKFGALDNSQQGIWSITPKGQEYLKMDPVAATEALRVADNLIRAEWRKAKKAAVGVDEGGVEDLDLEIAGTGDDLVDWKDSLLTVLKEMDPGAFERLAMRLLREAGFRNVEVLGRSNDGGIDGVGVYKVSLVSFPTYFQCKRYAGSVSPGVVRDFRGAMTGRGEKGLVITTGTFTPAAKQEATRDGAPPVDLIGGDELCDLLKDYALGVSVAKRVVEDITVEPSFFQSI